MISDVETCERNIRKFGSVTVFFGNQKVISKVVIRNIFIQHFRCNLKKVASKVLFVGNY